MTELRKDLMARARSVLDAETDDIVALAGIASDDPRTFFRGGDWRDCDFRNKDLRRFDFRDADLTGARFKGAYIDGARFDGAKGAVLDEADRTLPADRQVSTADLNAMIAQATDHSAAIQIHDAFRRTVAPDVRTRGNLMLKAETYGQALWSYNQFGRSELPVDGFALSILIGKAPDYETARPWAEMALGAGVPLSPQFFNRLLRQAPDWPTAAPLLGEMYRRGLRPDTNTSGIVTGKLAELGDRRWVLKTMKEYGLQPVGASFNIFLKHAKSFSDALAILEEMRAARVRRTDVTYGTLLRLADRRETIDQTLELMKADGVAATAPIYNQLIHKVRSVPDVRGIIRDMLDARLMPDRFTLSAVLARVGSFPDMIALLVELSEAGAEFDDVHVAELLKAAERAGVKIPWSGRTLPQEPRWARVARVAIAAAPSADQATDWLIRLAAGRRNGVETNAVAVAQMLKSPEEADRITARLNEAQIYASEAYYRTVYDMLAGVLPAEGLLAWHFARRHQRFRALETAVESYARRGAPGEGLRIALAFPYFAASRDLMRAEPDLAADVFTAFLGSEPGNATYALAYLDLELGRDKALASFRQARELASPGGRLDDIDKHIAALTAEGSTPS